MNNLRKNPPTDGDKPDTGQTYQADICNEFYKCKTNREGKPNQKKITVTSRNWAQVGIVGRMNVGWKRVTGTTQTRQKMKDIRMGPLGKILWEDRMKIRTGYQWYN